MFEQIVGYFYRAKIDRLKRKIERAKAEKFSLSNEISDGVMTTLGYCTQAWATLEILLDFVNWAIAKASSDTKPFPVALGRKLRFFREAHNSDVRLSHLRESGSRLADDIAALSRVRNRVVHGVARLGVAGSIITFYRHEVSSNQVDHHQLFSSEDTMTRSEIYDLAHDTKTLCDRIHDHGAGVIIALHPSSDQGEAVDHRPPRP